MPPEYRLIMNNDGTATIAQTDTIGNITDNTWTQYPNEKNIFFYKAKPHEPANAEHEDYDWTTDPEASQMAEAIAAEFDEASIEKLTTEVVAGNAADKQAIIDKAQNMAAIIYKGITYRRRHDSLQPNFEHVKETIKRIDGLGTRLQGLMDEFRTAQERIKNEEEFGEFDKLEKEFRNKFRDLHRETDKAADACHHSSGSLKQTYLHLDEGLIIEVMSADANDDIRFRLARQVVALINNYGIDNVKVEIEDRKEKANIVVTIPAKILETEDKEYRLSLSPVRVYWCPCDGVRFYAIYIKPKLSNDNRQHPHVMTDRIICLGNADVELGGSVKEGRVFDIFKTIETLLSDSKHYGTYHISNWPDCDIRCNVTNEWLDPKQAVNVQINGKNIKVNKDLVTICPVTGHNIIKDGDDAIEHEGIVYHRDAFLHAEGYEPITTTDPRAVTSILSQQKIHPANVVVCEISGIAGRKIDNKNNKYIQQPDDIIELPDGRRVAIAMLDLALLDETTTFGSRNNLLRGWPRDKKDQMQDIMSRLNRNHKQTRHRRVRFDWMDRSPVWAYTFDENQGVMLAN